jgi:hypothetical protein
VGAVNEVLVLTPMGERGGGRRINQSGVLMLICTSCNLSGSVRFFTCSASFSASRSCGDVGGMWI